jgi:hypothetical protein
VIPSASVTGRWLSVAAGSCPAVAAALAAFGGEVLPSPSGAPIDEARAEARALLPSLRDHIVQALIVEVDADQAALFARRVEQVSGWLERVAEADPDGGHALQLGLLARAWQVLAGPPPRALRVRAVADFYYSQGGLLAARARPDRASSPTIDALLASAAPRLVAPGVSCATVEAITQDGPFRACWLVVAPGSARITAARAPIDADGALAVVSGGFFLYSEPDVRPPERRGDPVGLLVSDGVVVGPPTFPRSALVVDAAGAWSVRVVTMDEVALQVGDATLVIGQGATITHRGHASRATGPGFAVATGQVVAVGADLDVATGGFVVTTPHTPAVGASVVYRLPIDGVHAAMAGGPRLLEGGHVVVGPERLRAEGFTATAPPITFSADETFDQNLLPRCAAGIRADGALVFLTIDGRHATRALGATLRGTARALQALGCVDAVNLDGGSSKRLIVEGVVQDLPSTDVVGVAATDPSAVRALRTALVIRRR